MTALLELGARAVPGIIGGISQIFGGKRRRKEEDAAMKQYKSLSSFFDEETDRFNDQLEAGYFNTAEAQGITNELKEQADLNNKRIASQVATGGMTDEAQIAMMGKNKEATAKGFSSLAQAAQNWRDRLLRERGFTQGQKVGITDRLFNAGQQRRANFNNSLSNILQPMSTSIGDYFDSQAA